MNRLAAKIADVLRGQSDLGIVKQIADVLIEDDPTLDRGYFLWCCGIRTAHQLRNRADSADLRLLD